jgi:hypothetical protein
MCQLEGTRHQDCYCQVIDYMVKARGVKANHGPTISALSNTHSSARSAKGWMRGDNDPRGVVGSMEWTERRTKQVSKINRTAWDISLLFLRSHHNHK